MVFCYKVGKLKMTTSYCKDSKPMIIMTSLIIITSLIIVDEICALLDRQNC